MEDGKRPLANPLVILREEFDDWAVLFDPDTGHGFGLSPSGVFVWKLLDGGHTTDGLLEEIRGHAEGVPEDAGVHIGAFVDSLVAQGLAAFHNAWPDRFKNADKAQSYPEASSCSLPGGVTTLKPFTYDPPKLVNLSSGQTTAGACSGGSAASCCKTGHLAGTCSYGNGGGVLYNCTPCGPGECVYYDDTNCQCVGSCNDACGCGGCVPPYPTCCAGSCASNEQCGAGCCDSFCGAYCTRPCEEGCYHYD